MCKDLILFPSFFQDSLSSKPKIYNITITKDVHIVFFFFFNFFNIRIITTTNEKTREFSSEPQNELLDTLNAVIRFGSSPIWVMHPVKQHFFWILQQSFSLKSCVCTDDRFLHFHFSLNLSSFLSAHFTRFLWSNSHLRSPALTLKKPCSLHFNKGWPFPLNLDYIWLWMTAEFRSALLEKTAW